jgi:hypothetical protein
MPVRIAVIAEADADRKQVCELIDRKIRHHAPDWWDDEQIEAEREYCGLRPNTSFTRWRDLRSLPSPEGALRRGGFIGFNKPGHVHSDYPSGRKALMVSFLAKPIVDIVILVRDMDDEPADRKASLQKARSEIPAGALKVVLALPNAKREAWVLNGYEPRSEQEETALAEFRKELGFDPRTHAERLDAREHGAKRDAKRVLKGLIGDNWEREAACWLETSWDVIRERGKNTGLTEFLEEVKTKVIPLVTGRPVGE